MELAAALQKRSFTIQCVLPSKFAQFLPRQTGAALFRTTTGDFEALFRPKGQTFDDVFISASPWTNGKGYRYTLRDPQGREVRRMDGRETIFVWDHNILFLAWDENTATAIMLGNTVRTQAASR